jgi:2-polyprenyl-3-methyl-5-hydroxy-6-metoxy-1,4-benzoquinol methylase
MVYANPVDPAVASGRFYDQLAQPYYLSPDKLQGDYAPVRFERELRLFCQHCQRGAVLDVGCSTGAFLHQLQARFPGAYAAVGNEVAGAALEYAAGRGIEVVRGPFLEVEFGGRLFDAVTFWAVLEHTTQPGRFLRKAATLLKSGGHSFVLVPNLNSLAARLLHSRYRYVMPEHLNYFTSQTLRALIATESAFALVGLCSTHFNPLVIWQDWRRPMPGVPAEERARLLKRTTDWKQRPGLAPVRAIYAAAERCLGWLRLADNLVAVLRRK